SVGDEVTLVATATSGLEVNYKSSDTDIAEIDGDKVTFKAAGDVTITASQAGDDTYESAEPVLMTVTIKKSQQSIEWNQNLSYISVGDEVTLVATATSGLEVNYKSSDTDIAEIDGDKVTFKAAGDVTITASQAGDDTYESAETVSMTITVKEAQSENPNEDITLNHSDATLNLETSLDLTIEEYEWTSSDESVATVAANGVVTAVASGNAVITLSRKSDGITLAECAITVEDAPTTFISESMIKKGIEVKLSGNEVIIEGAPASAPAWIYDVNGKTVYSGLDRKVALESGIYIVSIDGTQFKIKL
ncbi:MAG: Ig-like domain-containing protein, partial [Duncaniella sp.]|nr:Ig-like domain-containing protein [Duncaniella sp.]